MHLIIDGYASDPAKIKDLEFIHQFLDTYPKQIGMTKVSTPKVSRYHTPQDLEEGISGFVLLAESHISVHALPEISYISIDVFSCKDFDAEEAISRLEKQFGLKSIRSHTINRPNSLLG